MNIKTLSILIPVFNEEKFVIKLLEQVLEVELIDNIQKELIIVDDASSDNTKDIILEFIKNKQELNINFFEHEANTGKGGAIRTAIEKATGDYIIIQDADLEYDPHEFNRLLKPIHNGFADVVYGSRFKGDLPHRVLNYHHYMANRFLTFFSNLLTNLNLTDMETCYKMFRSEIIQSLNLKENRFGIEPEITAKISRIKGIRIYEVGISYYGRTYEEGKKINWKDGVKALYYIFKYNIFR